MKRLAKPQAVLWGAVFFAGFQLALVVGVDQWQPVLRDAQYGRKLALLEALQVKNSNPLLLMIGSSRTAVGFRPDRAVESPGEPIAVFNFGLPAAGPLKQRQCLESLLHRGVRPDRLLIEVMPALFNEAGPDRFCEENWLDVPGLAAGEMLRLQSYYSRPSQLGLAWARSRVLPCYRLRRRLLTPLAADWLTPRDQALPAEDIDLLGWQRLARQNASPQERAQQTERTGQTYAGAFRDFRIGTGPRQAMGDLLERCRQEQIAVVLVWMPEGSTFRRWYTAAAEEAISEMLREMSDRYGVSCLDARGWVDDADFWDGHHLLPEGAARFTRRLMDEMRNESINRPSKPCHGNRK